MATNQTRTIRFSERDIKDIEEFLIKNSSLDFSTMARIAIRQFIDNPVVNFRGLKESQQPQEEINSNYRNSL